LASIAPALAALFMILLTEGNLALYLTALTRTRDFFLNLPLLANLTVGVGAGLFVYLAVGAIVLSQHKVRDVKLG
jgi:hypothetical protein